MSSIVAPTLQQDRLMIRHAHVPESLWLRLSSARILIHV
jgi:hypothetical protein